MAGEFAKDIVNATTQSGGDLKSPLADKISVLNINGVAPMAQIDTTQCGVCDPSFRDNVLALMGFMYSTAWVKFTLSAAAGPLAVGSLGVDTSVTQNLPIFREGQGSTNGTVQGAPTGVLATMDYDSTNVPNAGFPGEGEAFAAIGAAVGFGQVIARETSGGNTLPGGVDGDVMNTPSMQGYRLRLIDALRASYSWYVSYEAQQNNNKVFQAGGLRHYPHFSGSPSGDNSVPYTNTVQYFTRFFVATAVGSTTARLRVFLHARKGVNRIMEDAALALRPELEALNTDSLYMPVELLLVGILHCAEQVCKTDTGTDARIARLEKLLEAALANR